LTLLPEAINTRTGFVFFPPHNNPPTTTHQPTRSGPHAVYSSSIMVVLSSDSNTTLVSLGDDDRQRRVKKQHLSFASPVSVVDAVVSSLIATPFPPIAFDDDDLVVTTAIQLPETSVRLALPKNKFTTTTFLQRYDELADQRDVLLAQDVVVFDDRTKETYVHVGQGEMATTTNTSDILMSDRATTCHILALWSCDTAATVESSSSPRPSSASPSTTSCSTLTHIDAVGYDECLKAVFAQHDAFHRHAPSTVYHVHMIGGFDDDSSHEISASILHCLALLSQSYRVVLETCVIGALNQDVCCGGPRLRGLALDGRTGRVYPAHCTAPMILGPVRALRLWSRGSDAAAKKQLLQLFPDPKDQTILIIPKCTWGRVSSRWNVLSDAELLAQCSTSPQYEDADDFCHHLRSTFAFCNQVTPDDIFGRKSVLAFRRFGRTNRWVPITTTTTTTTPSSLSG
jgi:Protein N-terminal asparagine amidohydrolase